MGEIPATDQNAEPVGWADAVRNYRAARAGMPLLGGLFATPSNSPTFASGQQRRGDGNPENNFLTLDISGRDIDVNGNGIFSTGFETNRLVTLGGHDTIVNDDLLDLLVARWHHPGSDDEPSAEPRQAGSVGE